MKHVLPALVAVVCTLAACETTADHRDLYAPSKPQGPYTAMLRGMTLAGAYDHKSTTYTYPVTEGSAPAPAEQGPIAPPPPPPGSEPNPAMPGATPLPQAVPAPQSSVPGPNAGASVIPGTSAPVTTPVAPSQPLAVPPPPAGAATPAPAGASNPPPAIPGLSQ